MLSTPERPISGRLSSAGPGARPAWIGAAGPLASSAAARPIAVVEQTSHAGVGQHRAAVVGQQHAGRRHPAVHEPARVDGRQGLGERHRERDDLGLLQWSVQRQDPVETDTRHAVVHQHHRSLD